MPLSLSAFALTVLRGKTHHLAAANKARRGTERDSAAAEAGKKVEGDSTWHGDTRTQPSTRKPTQQEQKKEEGKRANNKREREPRAIGKKEKADREKRDSNWKREK
jgi:hypothetical protein